MADVTAPEDARLPDAVLGAALRAWDAQSCPVDHAGCHADCPEDRPAQAMRVAWRAILADSLARSELLAALGHGDCVPRSWAGHNTLLDDHYPPDVFTGSSGDKGPRIVALTRALERAEADGDRLRACLSVLLRDIDEGEMTGRDPECVDLSITVNRADLDAVRAALDGEDAA